MIKGFENLKTSAIKTENNNAQPSAMHFIVCYIFNNGCTLLNLQTPEEVGEHFDRRLFLIMSPCIVVVNRIFHCKICESS